jgi:hypothetical protein
VSRFRRKSSISDRRFEEMCALSPVGMFQIDHRGWCAQELGSLPGAVAELEFANARVLVAGGRNKRLHLQTDIEERHAAGVAAHIPRPEPAHVL